MSDLGKIWWWRIYGWIIPPPKPLPPTPVNAPRPTRPTSRRINRTLPLILLTLPLFGQVSLEAVPETMAVTADIPLKVIGLWDLMVCNDGPAPRSDLYEERLKMAPWTWKAGPNAGKPAPIAFLTAAHATRVLQTKQARNKKQIAADLIGTGLDIAIPLLAFGPVAASKTVIGGAALGRSVAGLIQKRLQDQVPSITLFTDELLSGPLVLPPGGCTTRTVFANKMRTPGAVVARIP